MLTKQYYVYFGIGKYKILSHTTENFTRSKKLFTKGKFSCLTNWNNKVLYIGVTNDLKRRVYEHKNALTRGFRQKYNVNKLVYYEICEEIEAAILWLSPKVIFLREKQIKAGPRQKKNELIARTNPRWEDLADSI